MSVERVDAIDDPRLADYRAIRDGRLRAESGCFAAESREVVRRLLRERRYGVRSVLVTQPSLDALADVLAETTRVYVAGNDVIKDVVGFNFHRGCIAIGERGPGLSLDDALAAGPRRLVVCERISNPDNVGGIFRNAMAFGVDTVLLSPGCADPLYRKVVRVSIGGSLHVPFVEGVDWPGALGALRSAGIVVVALTTRGGVSLASVAPPARVALLVGTEGDGLSDDALRFADVHATIPMAPGVDSLNVAVACGIALHALAS